VLDRLQSAGHVRREPHPSDRRRTVVRMQPQALAVAQEFFVPLSDRMHTGAEEFTPAELDTAVRFLAAMDRQVRAAVEETAG
jgi:DNA-binding MarR family transcriptional regulator